MIIRVILGDDSPKTDDERVELVVSHGLDLMLREVLPKEEIFHQNAMAQMFARNPDFICKYVADMIRGGEEKEREQELRKRWLGDSVD